MARKNTKSTRKKDMSSSNFNKKIVGKGSLMHAVLQNPTWLQRNGPWAWNTSLPRDRVHTACARLITLCGNIFPGFRLKECFCSFVRLKHACQWLSGTPTAFRVGSFDMQEREVHASQMPCMAAEERGTLPTRDHRILLKLILLCLLSM